MNCSDFQQDNINSPHTKKKYATPRQKVLLQKAGEQTEKGLTAEEAQARIKALVAAGKLSQHDVDNIWRMLPASKKQLAYLSNLGVVVPPQLTRGEAEKLIEAHAAVPMTDRQREFILKLGGFPEAGMSSYQASKYIDWILEKQVQCPECESWISPFVQRCTDCDTALIPLSKNNRVPSSIYMPASQGIMRKIIAFFKGFY